ncbi:MAG: histidine kinase [Gammaproteobacteria bacterium]|nr:histidine kinase [Gammaproteobacteria bacterium]MBV8306190.1 histidine kinase [Gammaproteobacteria bacterium]
MHAVDGTSSRARSTPWLAIAALWLVIGVIDACQTVFPMRAQGMHHAWVALFITLLASWLPWALATPVVMELTRRYPLFRTPVAQGIMVHAAMLAVICVMSAAWYALLEFTLNPWAVPNPTDSYLTLMLAKLTYDVLTSLVAYALIMGITEFVASRERLARSQTEAAELRAELSEAKLAALRQQLEPHFIFNALNSACGLVRSNQNESAVRMLVGLSDYLRSAAERSQRPLVTLGDEVDYLEKYLDVQKFRFGARLQVAIDVPAELLPAMVPSLLLQPLAENAIKHGISRRVDGGAIQLSGSRVTDKLRLAMRNTAPPTDSQADSRGLGIGLSNLRARMNMLYGDGYELTMHRSDSESVEVHITLPLQRDRVDAHE